MFHLRNIVTGIEIGTSKMSVLVGEVDESGRVTVLGRGEAPSLNSVVKGEIINTEIAFTQLSEAIEKADQSSGKLVSSTRTVCVAVTGCRITSQMGVGSVFVKNSQRKITPDELCEAHENAQVVTLSPGREVVSSLDSFFLIDGRRMMNPLGQSATKLDAHVHVVHGDSELIENFRMLIRDSGFEQCGLYVAFSPLADDYGMLTDDDRERGLILVDMGAGTTEFVVEQQGGVMASGMIQIGFDHVANDLAIAFDLPFEACRKMLSGGELARAFTEKRTMVELTALGGRKRNIPLTSFETVISERLRETFGIVRELASAQTSLERLDCGGVITGGGALFPLSAPIFREVFSCSCRVGTPFEAGGAITGLDDPRYSTVWGVLNLAGRFHVFNESGSRGAVGNLLDTVDGLINRTRRTLRKGGN